jgi:hypothetical protein
MDYFFNQNLLWAEICPFGIKAGDFDGIGGAFFEGKVPFKGGVGTGFGAFSLCLRRTAGG